MTALAVRHYPESSVACLFFELLNIAQHLFRFDLWLNPGYLDSNYLEIHFPANESKKRNSGAYVLSIGS